MRTLIAVLVITSASYSQGAADAARSNATLASEEAMTEYGTGYTAWMASYNYGQQVSNTYGSAQFNLTPQQRTDVGNLRADYTDWHLQGYDEMFNGATILGAQYYFSAGNAAKQSGENYYNQGNYTAATAEFNAAAGYFVGAKSKSQAAAASFAFGKTKLDAAMAIMGY